MKINLFIAIVFRCRAAAWFHCFATMYNVEYAPPFAWKKSSILPLIYFHLSIYWLNHDQNHGWVVCTLLGRYSVYE